MLPVVNLDIFGGRLASIRSQKESDIKIYEKIRKENPALWMLIEIILEEEEYSYDFKDGYCKAAAQFYDLLSTQMEIDELERE